MGSTDHGTQEVTYKYFEEATSTDFNKKDVNIRPRGIYSGGYLTRVSDVAVTLSPFSLEIGDSTDQISVQTSTDASLTVGVLDSGTISVSTPYLVFRWGYLAQLVNFVEVHAVSSLAAAQDNDIIIGKCNFSGSTLVDFDYADRTFFNDQNLFLKVEASSGLYVQLRAGRIQSSSASIFVPEQTVGPFSVPGSPNSRIDLVYIDTDGTPTIQQGSAGVSPSAPSYANKLVVAEVTIVNGDSSIPASRIADARNFITSIASSSASYSPVTYTGQASVTLPNGLIWKNGTVSATSDTTVPVVFPVAFPSGIQTINLTRQGTNMTSSGFLQYSGESVTGFSVTNGGATQTVSWEAWGW